MLQCGGCSMQDANTLLQLLQNPALWVVVLAGATTLLSKKKKDEKK
jgi:hypothetical protein